MTTKKFNYKPIFAGFPWAMTLHVASDPGLFPVDSTWTAHVRTEVNSPKILATLTTENQRLARVDDQRIAISLDGAASTKWEQGTVVFDLVRTDGVDQHSSIRIEVAVEISATRGAL